MADTITPAETPDAAPRGQSIPFVIRAQNDQFRKTLTSARGLVECKVPGRVLITAGVSAGGEHFASMALRAVAEFDAFDSDNDPHGEHDFGAVTVAGRRLFFKFDYYDPGYEFGSENPADLSQTRRVLTIMLAEEY